MEFPGRIMQTDNHTSPMTLAKEVQTSARMTSENRIGVLEDEKKQRRIALHIHQHEKLMNGREDSLGKLMALWLEEAVVGHDQQQHHKTCSAGGYPSIGIRPFRIAL